jgi:hypothetical protein
VDIRHDLEIVANSIRLLPKWDWGDIYSKEAPDGWWSRFGELSGNSREYLFEKLTAIIEELDSRDRYRAGQACIYILMFFDNPALYEHLDTVAGTWSPQIPGRAGKRWSETICAAAWRVFVATQPGNILNKDGPC